MKVKIPHYSTAILASKNANLKDPDAIKFSKEIIASQQREIAAIKAILKRMGK